MKVFQDNQIYLLQRFGGISRYFVELNEALVSLDSHDLFEINAPVHFNAHLRQKRGIRGYIPFSTDLLRFNQLIRKVSDVESIRNIEKINPDIIHETYYRNFDPWPESVPRVTTIHDLIREKIDVDQSKILKKLNSIKHSRKIICISENTKMDLMDYYPFIQESQISVIYFGVNRSIFNDEFSGRKKNQIVYVGQRSGYKNFHVLLEAFKRSKKLRQELKLIVFGGGPFSRLENEFINSNGLSSFVENIQGNDEKLINLYRESIAMVYTSIYEGFGSPVLESMSSGCVVLANNTPALKEAGGSCAIYFDTRDVESLVFELENLFSTTEKIEELRKLGIERAKSFTWEKTAQLTKMVYEDILN